MVLRSTKIRVSGLGLPIYPEGREILRARDLEPMAESFCGLGPREVLDNGRPRSQRTTQVTEAHRDKLYPLCDRIRHVAIEMINQCDLPATTHGMIHPKILAAALLSRTLSNLKGVIALTKQGLVVEARVLARCCYENMFTVGGLYAEGEAFAKKMIEDNEAGRKGRVRFTVETPRIFYSLSAEMQDSVKEKHDTFAAGPKTGFLMPKQVAGLSEFKETYLVYSQFSGDAAHPTLMALARHWGPAGGKVAYFDVEPEPKESELDETLHLACISLMGIMVVVNEMHGYTQVGKTLPELNQKLLALQNEKWGADQISEGMEIRTERPKKIS